MLIPSARPLFSGAPRMPNNILRTSTSGTQWTQLNRGDSIFKLESGTYVFMGVLRAKFFRNTHNSFSVDLILDRDVPDYADGISIYKINQNVQELGFVNGSHLWGGKIISSPHPKIASTGVVPLNHVNPHNTNEDIFKKFGQPYYKLNSMATGAFGYHNLPTSILIPNIYGLKFERNTYGDRVSNINYLSEAYQFKPKTASSNIILRGNTNTTDKHWPYDERGQIDVYGSPTYDTIFHTNKTSTRIPIGTDSSDFGQDTRMASIKSAFYNLDNSFHRLFLYINSDILPYSSLRKDSIFSGTKDITNYNLLLLQDNSVSDNSLDDSSGKRKKLQDINYQTVPISSSDFTTSIKRAGIMRLTEMCFDFLYNPFNPEKPLSDSNDVISQLLRGNGYTASAVVGTIDVGATTTQHDAGNRNKIVFTGSITLTSNLKLMDDEGNFIGITAGSVTGTTHTCTGDIIYAANGTINFNSGTTFRSGFPSII